MKKYIIAIIFILGIMPNFNSDIIGGMTKVASQALGYEWGGGGIGDNDDCGISESYCSVCNDCYDSYTHSSCPTCCRSTCSECGTEYSCSESHECKESGSDVEKWCSICHSVHKGSCPLGSFCPKCGLYMSECICYKWNSKQ